jgi:hypothetical protein
MKQGARVVDDSLKPYHIWKENDEKKRNDEVLSYLQFVDNLLEQGPTSCFTMSVQKVEDRGSMGQHIEIKQLITMFTTGLQMTITEELQV